MLYVLEKWIAMRTVSGNPKYMEECRKGARFLKNILQQLGAVSRMVTPLYNIEIYIAKR